MEALLGPKIRDKRRELGLTQIELARRMGISASYLNLIESNKRRIAGKLLSGAARALDIRLEELSGAPERRLFETLQEIALLPALGGIEVDTSRTAELIGRHPGWARALAALARSERAAAQQARLLADRLTHDPFLGEAVHGMLTRIAAIRSAGEILTEYGDIPTPQLRRFHKIIHDEAQELSDVGGALAAYFDKTTERSAAVTPVDEVEALFELRQNRFGEIDRAASPLAPELEEVPAPARPDAARRLAGQTLARVIAETLYSHREIETERAKAKAEEALLGYAAAAILLPMETFPAEAAACGYDLEALTERSGLDLRTICHRLAALPPAEGVPRFGYIAANAAGTILEMLSLPELTVPRYASACPLWALYRAQQAPETVMRQRVLFPNGGRFVFAARARVAGSVGFGKPRHYVTDMITMSEEDAALTVYGPSAEVSVEEVGPACRLCPRETCIHRVEDPLTG
ncbi:MAG: short-chain fatty acyl-CoA regulator family protein [Pseudomonadota bacterium]